MNKMSFEHFNEYVAGVRENSNLEVQSRFLVRPNTRLISHQKANDNLSQQKTTTKQRNYKSTN